MFGRKKFDVRLVDYNLRSGLLKKEELQSHFAQIKDVKDNSEPIDLVDEEDIFRDSSHPDYN